MLHPVYSHTQDEAADSRILGHYGSCGVPGTAEEWWLVLWHASSPVLICAGKVEEVQEGEVDIFAQDHGMVVVSYLTTCLS